MNNDFNLLVNNAINKTKKYIQIYPIFSVFISNLIGIFLTSIYFVFYIKCATSCQIPCLKPCFDFFNFVSSKFLILILIFLLTIFLSYIYYEQKVTKHNN